MRILVVSDIHANYNALEAVIKDAGKVDAVWCLGDLVGYGPDPNESIELIRAQPNLSCLVGNHDAAVLDQVDMASFNHEAYLSVVWTRKVISPENRDFLASLPQRVEIGYVTLTHGSPRNPIWEYLLDLNTVVINFSFFKTSLCFVGHTHIPISYSYNGNGHVNWNVPQPGPAYKIGERTIVNPGSVGQPRDRDPRAAYAIFDSEERTWQAFRVTYDVSAVQQRILESDLPRRHALRLGEGW